MAHNQRTWNSLRSSSDSPYDGGNSHPTRRHHLLRLQIPHGCSQKLSPSTLQTPSQATIPPSGPTSSPSPPPPGSYPWLNQIPSRTTAQAGAIQDQRLGHTTSRLRCIQPSHPKSNSGTTAPPDLPPNATPSLHRPKHVVCRLTLWHPTNVLPHHSQTRLDHVYIPGQQT